MDKYIVILTQVLDNKEHKELYLSDVVNHIQFSEGIADAIPFPSFDEAKGIMNSKFISLSNWIAYSGHLVYGVFICELDGDGVIVGRTRYI